MAATKQSPTVVLQTEGLTRRFGQTLAVDGVNISVERGEFVSVLGPSGCGKTTLLRLIAGFITPSEGRLSIAGRDVTNAPPYLRSCGLVFQNYALFPHLTVFENVAYGLRARRVGKVEVARRVHDVLEMVRLTDKVKQHPKMLSGGQQQRVAIARALVTRPEILLLDEPLSNLDALLRNEMRVEIKRLIDQTSATTILVTHDQQEALSLADRVLILRNGRLQQVGAPEEIYERPRTASVATFMGTVNLFAVLESAPTAVPGRFAVTAEGGIRAEATRVDPAGRTANGQLFCVRPDRIRMQHAGSRDSSHVNVCRGTVTQRFYMGNAVQYIVVVGDLTFNVLHQVSAGDAYTIDDDVELAWDASSALLVDRDGPENGVA